MGRARRTAILLLSILTAAQTVLLVVFAQTIFLPVVWMIAIIAVVLIKQSAVTRDIGSRVIGIRRGTAKSQRHVARTLASMIGASDALQQKLADFAAEQHKTRAHVANVRRDLTDLLQQLAESHAALSAADDAIQERLTELVARHRDSGETLGLLREHLGRTGAQFDWLADRALRTVALLEDLERTAQDTASAIGTHHQTVVANDREVTAILNRQADSIVAVAPALTGKLDLVDNRVMEALTKARSEMTAAVGEVDHRLAGALDGGNSHSLERRIVAELSALAILHEPGDRALPPIDGWAMSPLAIQFVRSIAMKLSSDSTVIELGSGVSTAWIADALSRMPHPPRFIAVDHDPQYAATTERHIADIADRANASVILAPLDSVTVDDAQQRWYSTGWIEDVDNISLLIVDGPPAGKEPGARYPALPLLVDRLADEATILVDDAERLGEADVIARWMKIPGMRRQGFVGRSLVLEYSRPEMDGR